MDEEKKNEVEAEKPQEPFKKMSAGVGVLGCGVILAIGCFVGSFFPTCKFEAGLIVILPLTAIWLLYSDGAFSKKVPWKKRKRDLIFTPIIMVGVGLWRYYALTGRGDVWQSKLGLCITVGSFIWFVFGKEN